MTIAVAERIHSVTQATGIAETNVATLNLDLSRLLNNGFLIDVNLHGFSKLRVSVTWEELGMHAGDWRRTRMTKGTKHLAPKIYTSRLTSLEVRMRQILTQYTFDVSWFQPWRWLPFSAYDAWRETWDAKLEELESLKDDILHKYESIVQDNITYFKAVAQRAWTSYQVPSTESTLETASGKVYNGYKSFEDAVVLEALAKMPSKDEIQHGIYADYRVSILTIPDDFSAHLSRDSKAEAEAQEAWARAQEAMAEKRLIELEADSAHLAQQAKYDAIKAAELEHAREQLGALSPLQEVIESFRARIHADVVSIAESITKNGHIPGKVAEKARGLRDLYDIMAEATGDIELKTVLERLNRSLNRTPALPGDGKYNLASVQAALTAVEHITQDAAREVQRRIHADTRAAYLEF